MKNIAKIIIICAFTFTIAMFCRYEKVIMPILKELLSSDYCIEDGECPEGRVIIVDKDKEIVVNKQTCIENDGKWYEERKMCHFK